MNEKFIIRILLVFCGIIGIVISFVIFPILQKHGMLGHSIHAIIAVPSWFLFMISMGLIMFGK